MQINIFLCFFSLILLSSSYLTAQSDQQEIRQTFNKYFEIVGDLDTEKTLDFIYPKLFDHVPREMMVAAMENFKSDTTISITMKDFEIQQVSKSMEVEGIKYALVDYTFTMVMDMKLQSEEEEQENEEINPTQFTADILKIQYGEDNVKADLEKNLIEIHVPTALYTIKDPAYAGWKLLEKKENLMPILKQIIPEEVIKEL